MAVNPIQLSPTMDMQTLVSAINDTFRQIESENRTKVIKDETGTNRIILGRLPDGSYGLVVSKPGQDILALYSS